jgi:hypothetical protein
MLMHTGTLKFLTCSNLYLIFRVGAELLPLIFFLFTKNTCFVITGIVFILSFLYYISEINLKSFFKGETRKVPLFFKFGKKYTPQ